MVGTVFSSPLRRAEVCRNSWIVAFAAGAVLLAGCGGEKGADGAGEAKRVRRVAVETAPVERRSFTDYFELLGTVHGNREATMVFEVGGVVEEVIARKGSFVKKGDPIARLDDELYRAGLDEAEAALVIAKETYERSTALKEKGAIAEHDLSSLRQEYEMAKARRAGAKARWERTVLRAPFDGYVDERFLDEGDYASPVSPFVRVIDLSTVKVETPVPEAHLALVHEGGDAWITAGQYENRVFEGKITFVSREVDRSTRTVGVEVTLDNRDGALRPGMTVRARLVRKIYEEAIVVPQDAVVNTEHGPGVFLAVDGEAEMRNVGVEAVYNELAVIGSGLEAGETLITTGARDLVEGEAIEIVSGGEADVDH